jgi:hypothetical protein
LTAVLCGQRIGANPITSCSKSHGYPIVFNFMKRSGWLHSACVFNRRYFLPSV